MRDNCGLVYILTAPGSRDIKVGFTTDLQKRLRDLDNTSVARPFEPYMTVETAKYRKLEKIFHYELDKLTGSRVRPNREFFELDPAVAGDSLQNLSGLLDDALINNYGNVRESSVQPGGRIRLMSKPTTFKMLGIPVGSTLTSRVKRFPTVITTDEDNHVALPSGEIKTISRVVVDITNNSRNGFQVYRYNDKMLSDIRKELDKNYLPNNR